MLKPFFLFLLILIILRADLFAQGTNDYFGEVTIQIDQQEPETFSLQRALLYRKAGIAYDSTARVQSDKNFEILYYPQLKKGTQNILRLIAGQVSENKQNFYDLFINLGDSIPDSLHWENSRNQVVVAKDGMARSARMESSDLNGYVLVIENDDNEAVSGRLDFQFQQKLTTADESPHEISVKGDFDVPVGEYQQVSLSTAQTDKKMKDKYKRNIYAAIFISVFIIAIFGLR